MDHVHVSTSGSSWNVYDRPRQLETASAPGQKRFACPACRGASTLDQYDSVQPDGSLVPVTLVRCLPVKGNCREVTRVDDFPDLVEFDPKAPRVPVDAKERRKEAFNGARRRRPRKVPARRTSTSSTAVATTFPDDDPRRAAGRAYLLGTSEQVVRLEHGVSHFDVRAGAQAEAQRLGAGSLREAREMLRAEQAANAPQPPPTPSKKEEQTMSQPRADSTPGRKYDPKDVQRAIKQVLDEGNSVQQVAVDSGIWESTLKYYVRMERKRRGDVRPRARKSVAKKTASVSGKRPSARSTPPSGLAAAADSLRAIPYGEIRDLPKDVQEAIDTLLGAA